MSAPTTISRLLLVDDHRVVLRQVAPLLSGAFLAADLDATVYADTLAAFYQAPWDVLGGDMAFNLENQDLD